MNALVPSRDELDGALAEGKVVSEAPRHRRQGETLRGQKVLHAVGIHEVIEEPEVDVPGEAAVEIDEVAVAAECISERVRGLALVVTADALDGQVEAVGDAAGACCIVGPRPCRAWWGGSDEPRPEPAETPSRARGAASHNAARSDGAMAGR